MNIAFILFFTLWSLPNLQSKKRKCLPKNHYWKPYVATGAYPRSAFPVGVPKNYSRTFVARVTVPYKKWSRVVPAQLFNDHVESASMYGENKTVERYTDGIEILHVTDRSNYEWMPIEWHDCPHHDCPDHQCPEHPPKCPTDCEPTCPSKCRPEPPASPKPTKCPEAAGPPGLPTKKPQRPPTTTKTKRPPTTKRTKRPTTRRTKRPPTPTRCPGKNEPCDCDDMIEDICKKLRECCCFVEGGIGWDDEGATQIYHVGRVVDQGQIKIGRCLTRKYKKFGGEIGIFYPSGMKTRSRKNGFDVLTYDCDRKSPECLKLYRRLQGNAKPKGMF
ncbi:uncharacterized protein LOC123320492 [Coccinella septempunctata]|uniref:uncharacterized protein LOC123320492 n=1 Tax=Coccinella septempunctata TaxID=41139 RepID=UPI001D098731|nr:uncharacterized protein LOC123320492 [Coccinella septempunctata]